MRNEIDRYKRLLQEWNGEATPPPKDSGPAPGRSRGEHVTPPPTSGHQQKVRLTRPSGAIEPDGRYPSGTILCLDDQELVVFRRPVAGQNYDMVYSLLADGSVRIEGINLDEHSIFEMGKLGSQEIKALQTSMRWSRDLVASGCSNPEDADRIPDPDPTLSAGMSDPHAHPSHHTPPPRDSRGPQHTPPERMASRNDGAENITPQPTEKKKIRRGMKLLLKFGDKNWEAVYWGRDARGTVVAHKTNRHWDLMHLDLDRFKGSMKTSLEPDQALIEEISDQLVTQMKQMKE